MDESQQHIELIIGHAAGLHLRPAALFVKTAAAFESTIKLTNLDRPDSPSIDAKSMFGVLMLGIKQGHRVRVEANGPDAQEALRALETLVATNFEEPS